MKIDAFSITFEIVTDESAQDGDVAERGFCIEREQGYSLRDAVSWLRLHKGMDSPYGADCSLISTRHAPRWFSYDSGENYRTGEHEYLALHIPECVTASSRMRIARCLGYGKYWR